MISDASLLSTVAGIAGASVRKFVTNAPPGRKSRRIVPMRVERLAGLKHHLST